MLINDLKFEPTATKEITKVAKEFLLKTEDFNNTANFARVMVDGSIKENFGAQCHASIGINCTKVVSVVATEISNRSQHHSKKQREPFLRWFLYNSWFGRFILNREDFDFCQDYGIIVSADIPQPILQAIMIISRHFHECSTNSFTKFSDLVLKGVNGNIAYLFCFCSNLSTSKNGINTIFFCYTGHRAFPVFQLESFKNFLKGDLGETYPDSFFTDKKNNYSSFQSIYGVSKLFHTKKEFDAVRVGNHISNSFGTNFKTIVHNLASSDKDFVEVLSSYRKETTQGEQYKPPNPFSQTPKTPSPSQPYEVTYNELFDVVIPYIDKNFG